MTNSTDEELKACPFCGGEGVEWHEFDIRRAGCKDDKCPASFLDDGIDFHVWNTRPDDWVGVEVIKELSSIVDDLEDAWEDSNNSLLNEDMVEAAQDRVKRLICKVSGGHKHTFDQCGWWQHQFCMVCGEGKYPELVGRRCGDIQEEMGSKSEEEYCKDTQPKERSE